MPLSKTVHIICVSYTSSAPIFDMPAGQNDDYKATIDFAGLNSVLYIPTNRTLTFHNVRLVGIPPANSNSLGAFAAFPALSASASWPSIIIDVDATVTSPPAT